jgi:hypothetical protein
MPYTLLSEVKPQRVSWLWPGRIPFGKLTILDGDPGLGKSTLMLDLAARLSTGRELPGGAKHDPAGTIILMVEDGLADTVVPRLQNAGADLSRIISLDMVLDEEGNNQLPSLPSCIPDLANLVAPVEAKLIIVDPIMSYLGEKTSSKDDQSVRRALTPLASFADQTGIAVVVLRHFNKASKLDVIYRGQGSIGFIGIARSGLVVGHDPDDPSRNVLASSKSNLGPIPPSLAYRLVNCENDAARVDWEGVSYHTAQTITDQPQDEEGRTALDEAVDFLRDRLANGRTLSTAVQKSAREAGLAWDTVRRAQRKLRIVPKKAQEQDGQWTWALPDEVVETPDTHNINKNNNFNIFNVLREDVEVVEGVEDVGVNGNHTFEAPENIPRAATSGPGYDCAVCGEPIKFAMAGRPLLCKVHREWYTTLGLTAD